MNVDGKNISDTDRLRLLILDETEGASPIYEPPSVTEALDTLTTLLETGATARVLRLSPNEWREMGPAARRGLLDFAVARAEALEKKIAFMSRNLAAGDFEMPAYLRSGGAL